MVLGIRVRERRSEWKAFALSSLFSLLSLSVSLEFHPPPSRLSLIHLPNPFGVQSPSAIQPALCSFAPDATSGQLGIQGILVLDCMPNGPADRAGIKGTSRDTYGRLR